MITVQLMGGHGNQLFQWAFGMAQAKRLGVKLQLNTSLLGGARPYSLDQWAGDKLVTPYATRAQIVEQGMPYNSVFAGNVANGDVIQGYFQTEKYFTSIEEELKALRPRITDNVTLEAVFSTLQPVAVHVRRGDYLKEPHKSFHGNLDMNYYREAMKHVSNQVRHAKFFIFSDDPTWCRENFEGCTIVEPTEAASDVHSMSNCKHNIIANSSFSWWGAWLGKVRDRVVVAPKNWFQSNEVDARDIVPERWTRI